MRKGGREKMITFEKAKQIAKRCIPDINLVYEYPDAYIFSTSSKGSDEWDDDVVIDKKTGTVISHTQFALRNRSNKEVQGRLIV